MIQSAIPHILLLSVIALLGCTDSYEPTNESDLNESFEAEFGFSPSESASDIESKTQRVGDAWSKWMRFRGNKDLLSRIIENKFELWAPDTAKGSVVIWSQPSPRTLPDAPSWWRIPKRPFVVYYRSDFRDDFSGSYHVVWIDEEAGYIWSQSSAWD